MKASELIKFLQRAEEGAEVEVKHHNKYGDKYNQDIIGCTISVGAGDDVMVITINVKDKEKKE